MGVQQLIANNTNIIVSATATADAVAPSSEITRTGFTRSGTGLVELTGPYTGHDDATFDILIVSGEGNGRASTPEFTGVGSGPLSITSSSLPAQDVTITLLTPPYPGAKAEALIGPDIIRAIDTGSDGNLIFLTVDRSGLSFTPSGSSTLEEIKAGQTELTGYKWDIAGVVCSADHSGKVPSDAPRVKFGSDPAVYRIVKDARSGSLKTVITPAAIRDVSTGTPIMLVTGSYTATVFCPTCLSETYPDLITAYDLVSALLASAIVQPAYTPAPVQTIGGNAADRTSVV